MCTARVQTAESIAAVVAAAVAAAAACCGASSLVGELWLRREIQFSCCRQRSLTSKLHGMNATGIAATVTVVEEGLSPLLLLWLLWLRP